MRLQEYPTHIIEEVGRVGGQLANRNGGYSVHIRVDVDEETRVLEGKRLRLQMEWRLGNQILEGCRENKPRLHSVLDCECRGWRDVAVKEIKESAFID